jgi:enamine deaminase RidA (YjgF/YER057c/UK114 family)
MPGGGEAGVAERLRRLGIVLPEPPRPLGRYVAAARTGPLLFLSGMLPLDSGRPVATGRLGSDVSIEAGRTAARVAALNALAVADQFLGGLDGLRRAVRVSGSIATTAEFADHAIVADGASEVFSLLFDEGHTRVVAGVHTLPLGVPVLLDVVFEITEGAK